MKNKQSAGLLLYRRRKGTLQVLLVHPGGPFWQNRDEGAWSIPKGEVGEGEDPLAAAVREFAEETGFLVSGRFIAMDPVRMKSGKLIRAWALHRNVNAARVRSNNFEMEWPPKSGRSRLFPEVDRAAWLDIPGGLKKINGAQQDFIRQLVQLVGQ